MIHHIHMAFPRLFVALGVVALAVACPQAADGPCGEKLQATWPVVQAGRLVIPLTDDLRDDNLKSVRPSEGMSARLDNDAVVVRAPPDAGAHTLTLVCANATREITIDVQERKFAPVASWQEDEDNGVPGGREYFAAWMSPSATERALYLYGGFAYVPQQFTPRRELYRFDLETLSWSSVALSGPLPAPGGRVAAAPDGVRHLGGAEELADGSLYTPSQFLKFSLTDEGAAFVEEASSQTAPGSYTGSLFYDARRDRWLSVCGAESESIGVNCAVHASTSGGDWQSVAVAGAVAPGRYGFHFAYDEEEDRVVVYAGQGVGDQIRWDTWFLDLSKSPPEWSQLQEESGLKRRNGAYAYDPVHHRLLVWGGTGDGATSRQGMDSLDLDRGQERWQHIDDVGAPARSSAQCILDEQETRFLCGLGNSSTIFTDLWSFPLLDP